MATKDLKTKPKISVKIWRPILDRLDKKIEQACLRRDAYLSKVLEVELGQLDEEVSIANSQASYDYVFSRLDALDRKLVSLALPPELTARLNEICSRKRIVRDAFFNRLFLLLTASPKVIDQLFFHGADGWRSEVWSEHQHDGPFFQNVFYPLEPDIDPFWPIRCGLLIWQDEDHHPKDPTAKLEDYLEPTSGKVIRVCRNLHLDGNDDAETIDPVESIYTKIFHQKASGHDLLGLSCHVPDWAIPGHAAQQKFQATLDEIFSDLEAQP